MIDYISRGRLISGCVRGGGVESLAYEEAQKNYQLVIGTPTQVIEKLRYVPVSYWASGICICGRMTATSATRTRCTVSSFWAKKCYRPCVLPKSLDRTTCLRERLGRRLCPGRLGGE
jgi:hypothetical protein